MAKLAKTIFLVRDLLPCGLDFGGGAEDGDQPFLTLFPKILLFPKGYKFVDGADVATADGSFCCLYLGPRPSMDPCLPVCCVKVC